MGWGRQFFPLRTTLVVEGYKLDKVVFVMGLGEVVLERAEVLPSPDGTTVHHNFLVCCLKGLVSIFLCVWVHAESSG